MPLSRESAMNYPYMCKRITEFAGDATGYSSHPTDIQWVSLRHEMAHQTPGLV